jgi:hypothetical protein
MQYGSSAALSLTGSTRSDRLYDTEEVVMESKSIDVQGIQMR